MKPNKTETIRIVYATVYIFYLFLLKGFHQGMETSTPKIPGGGKPYCIILQVTQQRACQCFGALLHRQSK